MAELVRFVLVGVGGTVTLDLWALLLARLFKVPPVNWRMVGRWIGNMPRGRFVHADMAKVGPIAGEAMIGWGAHYIIGIGYGLLLLMFWGSPWIARPTLLPPMIVSWVLLAAPYFIMMPGMGSGIAGSKTHRPNVTRMKSVIGHSVFGFGMYAAARAIAEVWPAT
ncbi:DUF2938 domain-containing protein [Novosphingobium sp. YAF33]|uniref:DUF2938 domain-containing protein n=1 Tax=Novosphingobium sp. YAF33 TaxID=3233082 RepID=UPI003F9D26FF